MNLFYKLNTVGLIASLIVVIAKLFDMYDGSWGSVFLNISFLVIGRLMLWYVEASEAKNETK